MDFGNTENVLSKCHYFCLFFRLFSIEPIKKATTQIFVDRTNIEYYIVYILDNILQTCCIAESVLSFKVF